jgi:hypothetical protein
MGELEYTLFPLGNVKPEDALLFSCGMCGETILSGDLERHAVSHGKTRFSANTRAAFKSRGPSRMKIVQRLGENEMFALGAFDKQIGKVVPVNLRRTEDGPVLATAGTVRLVSAEISEDGSSATLTFETVEEGGEDEQARGADSDPVKDHGIGRQAGKGGPDSADEARGQS